MTQTTLMDDVPLNRFHLKITGLTFGAHLTDGYILGSVGFALTQMTPQMALTPFWQGMIGSSALLGLFLGSLILGWIADTVGRQKIFCFSFILITLASGMQFFVESAEQLFLLRMLIGFGLGGDFAVGHTILAEFAPRKHRGVLLGAFSVLWTIGYVAASFVGHLALQTDAEGWRWLLRRGRRDEAVKIVHRLFGANVTLQEERQQIQDGSLSALFRPRYRRRTAFNCLFFVCLVIPYFAIYTFLPAILRQMGLDQGFATDLLLSGLLLVGAVLGIVLTALCSRRGFLIGSFVFLAACLLLLSLLHNSAGIWLIVLFAAFTLVMSAVSNLVGVFPAESFPTDVRSRGVGFATSMSRLGSAVGTLLLPLAIVNYGIAGTMALLAAILVLGALVSIAWAPETKGLTLTDASQETPPAEPTLNPPPSTSTQHL